ncbi:cytochrome c biogenesis protein CcsA [Aliifodinibius sp. S!AR15-10]|uniref:cytochrome c biogenesis protein CcsA n=1 Tax=Aliifodinibius sp. S!AR15-10 TaxID=2950437 RepID=UPI00285D2159|nr:cytochrome c biogenesis protein CcsA [Aliifodinibius sp. S!AR15-10]MDR8389953.1 cytochrome c biogenesis protein CcsA [Aliifodinibius sp. S!AR15-10]
MTKRLLSLFISTRLMALLFILFAVAMGYGTFIEHWYNTETARKLVYNSWWFEGIMVLLIINFIANIGRYNLLKKEKWLVLLLHLALMLIIVGASWTRYLGFEGTMSIREGETTNRVLSKKNYLIAVVEGKTNDQLQRTTIRRPILLSPVTDNHFKIQEQLGDKSFRISLNRYVMNAKRIIQKNPDGDLYLKMVIAHNGSSGEYFLQEGEPQLINNVLFSFSKYVNGAINIIKDGDSYSINSPIEGTFTRMSDELQKHLHSNEPARLMYKWVYDLGEMQLVVPQLPKQGFLDYESNNDYTDNETEDILILNIESGDSKREVVVKGNKGKRGSPIIFEHNGLTFTISLGSKVHELPFKLTLRDFTAKKYPGTEKSYSSFESEVTVIAGAKSFDTKIFMNNVLDYDGYRFFQASFHPDERGTILSVNHDFWGTWITYTGYFLLYIGLISILFDNNSRFGRIRKKLKVLSSRKVGLPLFFIVLSSSALGAQTPGDFNIEDDGLRSSLSEHIVSNDHAEKFGRLVIQDGGGRMKPVNTFSSELLRKVYNASSFKNYAADQVFLSIIQFPEFWYEVPFIKIKNKNQQLLRMLGLSPQTEYIALENLFDEDGRYKLSMLLGEAYQAFIPNQFQKDVIDLDRKANLLHFVLSGKILRIFPIPEDSNNRWVSFSELEQSALNKSDSLFIKNILPLYLSSLSEAVSTGDYNETNNFLQKIVNYQKKYGYEVRPSESKISAEIIYNEYNIFEKLFLWYLLSGAVMIIMGVLRVFWRSKWVTVSTTILHWNIGLLFLLHSIGLVMRWYIAGHAPWSDAYESIVYVSWATMLFGLYLGRKSPLTLGATAFVSSIILMVAHWNWMDPAIANLQPVLNSYWLMVHVAIIVASYGPFTLGMILGLITLFFMVFANNKNKARIKVGVTELVYITELSLTIGLVMLTIGNFLGGQWANESWGRYWGWDPKETWALISIIVYAFVIHMRIVPALKGKWLFSLMSVLAYYSILMTYFGVNFYLTGLHSYASGDKIVTPNFIYYSIAAIALLASFAYLKDRKYLRKGIYGTR